MSLNPHTGKGLFDSLLGAPLNRRLALLFPGQGAQRVGMGKDVWEQSQAAREVFSRADEAFDDGLSLLCFNGPQDRLIRTEIAQPAIVATSAAYLAAAIESRALHERPAYVAGHSLGEYTGLVAAGALPIDVAVRLVKERGRLMSEAGHANPGTMAAVLGLDKATVEEVCAESGAHPANYNGPTQTVVGGTVEAVQKATSLAKARGGKVLPVGVSGAFHTSLMSAASESFTAHVAEAAIDDPRIPVVSNVTATPLVDSGQVREDLAQQVARPVQWAKSVEYMLEEGVDTFVEIGPGRTLSAMLNRMAPNTTTLNFDSAESMSAALNV